MDVHECIRTRRSLRKYKYDQVTRDKLYKVLEAVQWSPSWVNTQVWEVVVVDDPKVKNALQACVPQNNPGRKSVVQAPIILAVCGRVGKSGFYDNKPVTVYGDWVMFDVAIACQNICLAAWAEGLGTLHLGMFDHQKGAEVLGLPEDVLLYELIPLGFPYKEGKAPPRRPIEEFTHNNRFGSRLG